MGRGAKVVGNVTTRIGAKHTENKYAPTQHDRRSIRLQGYDYSQAGLYFITFCVQHRVCLFGRIEEGVLHLNDAGKMVEEAWLALSLRFPDIELHEYVVMPNHFHAILEIVGDGEGQPPGIARTGRTVGNILGAFKSLTTVQYIRAVQDKGWKSFKGRLWQRNYWEHIIWDERTLENIANYIRTNPLRWDADTLKLV